MLSFFIKWSVHPIACWRGILPTFVLHQFLIALPIDHGICALIGRIEFFLMANHFFGRELESHNLGRHPRCYSIGRY